MAENYYIPVEPETITDLLSLYDAYEAFGHLLAQSSSDQVDRLQILAMLDFLNERFSFLSADLRSDVVSVEALTSQGYVFPGPTPFSAD